MEVDIQPGNDPGKYSAELETVLQRVSALPGVESAGIADMLPLDRNRSWALQAAGKVYPKDYNSTVFVYLVTPGYIPTIGMRLLQGRDFNWHDTVNSQHVIVINEATARREWPGEDPIGKFANNIEKNPVQVVGVIADVRESSLEEISSPEVYIPMTQNSDAEGATLVVRTRIAPDSLSSAVLGTLRSLNPGQPATEFRPLQAFVDHAVSPRRFFVLLVAIFAALGVLLASLGIYGVISYSLTQKTQEIGIRMALGASRERVQREILFSTLRLATGGIVLGCVASAVASRLIASLLYATSPWDLVTYAWMVLAVMALALISGYLPARRASRIDPMVAIRSN
jgi:predicted permease